MKQLNGEYAYYWTFEIYPESVIDNWLDIIQEYCEKKSVVWVAISPLHNKDVNDIGEIKKEHQHIVIKYKNLTSYSIVKKLVDKVKGVIAPLVEKNGKPFCKCAVVEYNYMLAYLVHKDRKSLRDETKYKYNEDDIILFGEIKLERIKSIISKEEYKEIDRNEELYNLINFALKNDILYIDLLYIYCYNNNKLWFNIMNNQKYLNIIKTCLTSADVRNRRALSNGIAPVMVEIEDE